MTGPIWGNPDTGMFYLKYAGRELEVRRRKLSALSGKGTREKPYQVIVDGILTDLAWSTTEAKTKAMKTAERTHKGETILPYEQRQKDREERAAVRAAKAPAWSPSDMHDPDKPEELPTNVVRADFQEAFKPLVSVGASSLALLTGTSSDRRDDGAVTFTITGSLNDLSPTDALNIIRAAVELLREHGEVKCNAVVPRKIEL